jgi:hypothetical protein
MSSQENGDEKIREMTGKTTAKIPTATTVRLLPSNVHLESWTPSRSGFGCTGSRPVYLCSQPTPREATAASLHD